ncbi:MAG TPA: hypothetical protein VIV60_32520 [Polyangiaceae bacterium]
MTLGHLIYLPVVFLVGMAFGYILGAKAVRREVAEAKRKVQS